VIRFSGQKSQRQERRTKDFDVYRHSSPLTGRDACRRPKVGPYSFFGTTDHVGNGRAAAAGDRQSGCIATTLLSGNMVSRRAAAMSIKMKKIPTPTGNRKPDSDTAGAPEDQRR
jgi:hypothetical protein